MIHDGHNTFKNSCVDYVEFKHFEVQQWFSYLRELEHVLQCDISRLSKEANVPQVKEFLETYARHPNWLLLKSLIKLTMVQGNLCYLVGGGNCIGDEIEVELRRRGFGGDQRVILRRQKEAIERKKKINKVRESLGVVNG